MANLLLHGAAGDATGALGLGSGLLARGALQLLAFCFVGDVLGVHQSLFNPAYFSTSFFNPKRGKFTVILASSPSPSRRTTVPVPYLGCSTVMPARAERFTGAAAGRTACTGRGLPIGRGNCGGVRGSGGLAGTGGGEGLKVMPRSLKNCEMLSSELYVLPVY